MHEGLDLDWYALDLSNKIVRFASAGGRIPVSIKDIEEQVLLNDYFRSLPDISNELRINLVFPDEESYLRDFKLIAKKGLICFDKTDVSRSWDNKYHKVCSPLRYLMVQDLPAHVQKVLLSNKIDFDAENLGFIDISPYVEQRK